MVELEASTIATMRVLALLPGLLCALAGGSLLERHCDRAHHSVGAEFAADRSIRQRLLN